MISIIITSMKDKIATLSTIKLDAEHEIIISRKHGLGFARNWGARQAKGDLLVFLDDDLILKNGFWDEVSKIREGQFSMPYPIVARVLAIHRKDFWKIGGFDERIRVTCEDVDFYFRAIEKGLKFRIFPSNLFVHIEHPDHRFSNIYKSIRAVREALTFTVKYGKKYPKLIPNFFWDNIKKFKLRTLLLGIILLPYCLYKKDY
ncbi:MAG: glycosyltransferase [Candidatus Bathyarchaeia archaeon]